MSMKGWEVVTEALSLSQCLLRVSSAFGCGFLHCRELQQGWGFLASPSPPCTMWGGPGSLQHRLPLSLLAPL